MPKADAVIKCVDPRVQKSIRQFLEREGLPEGTWAPLTIPGASLNLKTVLSSIDLVVEHLGAKQILVFDHKDCLAFKREHREFDCEHTKCLHEARELLEDRYPDVTVRTFFMFPKKGKKWGIEEY